MMNPDLLKEPQNLDELLVFVQALYDEAEKQGWSFVLDAFKNQRPWGYNYPPTEEQIRYTLCLTAVADSDEIAVIPQDVRAVIASSADKFDALLKKGGLFRSGASITKKRPI